MGIPWLEINKCNWNNDPIYNVWSCLQYMQHMNIQHIQIRIQHIQTYIYMCKHIQAYVNTYRYISLHKKWSFPFRISLIDVTKSAVNSNLITFTEEILNGKPQFLCSV